MVHLEFEGCKLFQPHSDNLWLGIRYPIESIMNARKFVYFECEKEKMLLGVE